MSVEIIATCGDYAIVRVGWHGKQVIDTRKNKPYEAVSALYDTADSEKKCWDWLVHNVDEAIHYAPIWYINATHDALG
jgi:hypothetical protein